MSDKQGWSEGPQHRGSFDILWTCLSTLALCVWTAVHPNILQAPSFKRSLLSRLGMMVVAVVFPELIISAAWRQLRSAQWLHPRINALIQDPLATSNSHGGSNIDQPVMAKNAARRRTDEQDIEEALLPTFSSAPVSEDVSSNHLRKSWSSWSRREENVPRTVTRKATEEKPGLSWSLEHAFFVVMGGFAIENDYLDDSNVKVTIRRLVTVEGVLQLAKLHLVPAISLEDIDDRSQADIIAKVLVLSQITWFALQVIGRLAADLPITLLEVHTVIHVGCTIVIYLIWLKKPYDVHRSILLSNTDVKDMGALFNFYKINVEMHRRACSDYEIARVGYWKDRVVRASNNLLDHDPPPDPPVKEALTVMVSRYQPRRDSLQLIPRKSVRNASSSGAKLSNTEETILKAFAPAALRGIEQLKNRGGFTDNSINAQNWDFLRESSENFTIKEVWGSWSTNTGHEMSLDKGVHFIFNLLYGGGHLSAWASSAFPSLREAELWRVSAIMLTAVPIWGVLWILWWKAVSSKQKWLFPFRNGDFDIAAAPFFLAIVLAYFLARGYFLVESLISLRLLPEGAFLTVNWARYLPHVS
ncbi:hypothetical protein BP5796_03521 [Coleophoma crateriformis]|uniref:Uncharacterized protein n=1 Tax=Coleophoma crateriformis TaxID=565419 RepID=A0A3D8SNE4_9HELO|nr:hypothetical protein BP5796_03521 [Coleophoma crateriformis]